MAGYDYHVVIIGSGFGGSVAALRAAEKGYRVGVMESAVVGTTRTSRSPSGICRTSCGSPPLMCQCHGSRFDIATGAVLRGPATRALEVHEVREVGGRMQLRA